MGTLLDLTGKVFGKWTVLSRAPGACCDGKPLWNCKCECGTERVVAGRQLKRGKSESCGLCRVYTRTSLRWSKGYQVWKSMWARCKQKNNKDYKYYGARGITICDHWLNWRNFIEDMGQPPAGLTLDRIDNDKGYFKENCRWATRSQQNANKRRKVLTAQDLLGND